MANRAGQHRESKTPPKKMVGVSVNHEIIRLFKHLQRRSDATNGRLFIAAILRYTFASATDKGLWMRYAERIDSGECTLTELISEINKEIIGAKT